MIRHALEIIVCAIAIITMMVLLAGYIFGADESAIPASQLRRAGLHDCGNWYLFVENGEYPSPSGNINPETGESPRSGLFPNQPTQRAVFMIQFVIGGVVGNDTLFSNANDLTTHTYNNNFWPEYPDSGGMIRTGDYADDEFENRFADTLTDPAYVGQVNPYDTAYVPLGVAIYQKSYSWADSLYDNFIIFEYTIKNTQSDTIRDLWLGWYMDADIVYAGNGSGNYDDYRDDITGCLDTLLYENDPSSRIMIPYIFDNDGNPDIYGESWIQSSMRQAVSFCVLESDFESPDYNYNWWLNNYFPNLDYGPRKVGTPEDPFREFAGGFLGAPMTREERYYVLSHPEVDYNQIYMAAIDSTSGWILHPDPYENTAADTRFLLSVGAKDLAPGDSVSIVAALVGTEYFHVNASDYIDTFDPDSPEVYEGLLDFNAMLNEHRKVDSVYKSGLTLPRPGAPVGLHISSHEDSYVDLHWTPSRNGNVIGYFINIKDTVYDDAWRHAHLNAVTDTVFRYQVSNPAHEYFFSITSIDNKGRESLPSFWTSVIPGLPKSPIDVSVSLDGLIPVISWRPAIDTSLQAYYIYRAMNSELFTLYDSSVSLIYRDYNTESGINYRYYLTTVNPLGLESLPSDIVNALPMALDSGLLYFDMNYDGTVSVDPFRWENLEPLLESIESNYDIAYMDIETDILSLKALSHFELTVFISEKAGGTFSKTLKDAAYNYLSHGGKALFICPNTATTTVGIVNMRVSRFQPGSFFYDILKLDSSFTNAIIFSSGEVKGDLIGSMSENIDFPDLSTDYDKLLYSPFEISGGIPMSGCLFPREGLAEIIYRYGSLYPDSMYHNQVNGIRYHDSIYQFVLLNFPLGLMITPENIEAFRSSLRYLGINLSCGDYDDDGRVNISDVIHYINFLYRDGNPPPDVWRADIDCDSNIGLGDVLLVINRIFKNGGPLECCPVD
ncbi:MAG: hypothetical protein KAR42_11815 [candidate division Zixibacteria bacterium]|nr:hypothetical protein [candidate division Zixibacteria bacterium]